MKWKTFPLVARAAMAHTWSCLKSHELISTKIYFITFHFFFHPSQITVTGSTRGSMESIKSQGERENLSDFHFGSIWRGGSCSTIFSYVNAFLSPFALFPNEWLAAGVCTQKEINNRKHTLCNIYDRWDCRWVVGVKWIYIFFPVYFCGFTFHSVAKQKWTVSAFFTPSIHSTAEVKLVSSERERSRKKTK